MFYVLSHQEVDNNIIQRAKLCILKYSLNTLNSNMYKFVSITYICRNIQNHESGKVG